jgi:2-amino-4-hydroxy-6-hydroxymethyldihydropteridine diphosphokinase
MAGHTVYLSLGSNLGDRRAQMEDALARLETERVRIVKRSSLYETEPVEVTDQPWFLNCAVEAQTELAPRDLLDAIDRIEQQLGRERAIARGPRTIDIDVLLYDAITLHTPQLEIPHPRMAQRRFVLMPLAEIAPSLMHPTSQRTIADLLAACEDRSEVRLWQS